MHYIGRIYLNSANGLLGISGQHFLLLQCLQKLNLYDAEFVAGLVAIFGLEKVELAGCRLYHLYNLSEGIAVLGCTLQADGIFRFLDKVKIIFLTKEQKNRMTKMA